jgi:hypothetical protein
MRERGIKMVKVCKQKPELLLKLSATSVSLSLAFAKLYSYKKSLENEIEKDINYVKELEKTYNDFDQEEILAEKFNAVSYELDKLMIDWVDEK